MHRRGISARPIQSAASAVPIFTCRELGPISFLFEDSQTICKCYRYLTERFDKRYFGDITIPDSQDPYSSMNHRSIHQGSLSDGMCHKHIEYAQPYTHMRGDRHSLNSLPNHKSETISPFEGHLNLLQPCEGKGEMKIPLKSPLPNEL